MIQPIGAFSPRAEFRGHGVKSGKATPQERSKAQVALINAAGTSVIAGAFTTAIARGFTSSWAQAGVLGVCGTFLSMFFIAPMLVENTTLLKSKKKQHMNSQGIRENATAKSVAKNSLKPAKRFVPFKQS